MLSKHILVGVVQQSDQFESQQIDVIDLTDHWYGVRQEIHRVEDIDDDAG